MQRLGKNAGRYLGETIEIERVQSETHRLALANGWQCDTFLDEPGITLRGYRRPKPGATKNFYFSTGIHGDEPSGPLAMLQLVELNHWPEANLWLIPCLNPTGFKLNSRFNADGIDLNRDYRHFRSREVKAHVAWLETLPRIDTCLVLHEDWEANGYYIYETNPHNLPSLAEPIIVSMRGRFPIEHAEKVDNWPHKDGVIRPHIKPEDRPEWAEALWLVVNKAQRSYTMEAPSDFPLDFRVKAHHHAVRQAFELLDAGV
jgi:protein MpaA